MAKKTQEEILAQREAWLARKAARESGQDVPQQRPAKPDEEPPKPEAAEPPADAAATPAKPQPAAGKRTPEEVRAQREAFLAARAAKASRTATPAETAAPVAEKPAMPAAKPAPERPAAAKPEPKARPAARPAPQPEPADSNVTRREFLNYAWLASIALFSAETVGLSLWFAFPKFKAGQFGGLFTIGEASSVLPQVNADPIPYTDGKFWLVNLDTKGPNGEPRKGIMALYKVCTHLGCLYDWVPMTNRFECPCHGSKFALTGDYLAGPAPRSLDRFVIQAVAPDGSIKETDANGDPLVINGNETLNVDTGKRIFGKPHA